MKREILLLLSASLLCIDFASSQNIAVNTTGTAAAAANMFEVTQASTTTNTVGIFATHTGAATNAYAIWAAATAGTNKYAIVVPSSSGYVGFGTTAPQRLLHLVGPSGAVATFPSGALGTRDILLIENNANSNMAFIAGTTNLSRIRFVDDAAAANAGWMEYDHSGDFMDFATATAERMRITSAGDVGIGTSSPGAKLHVSGSAPLMLLTATGGVNDWAGIRFEKSDLSPTLRWALYSGSGGVGNTSLGFYDYIYGGDRMTITSAGKVGIGTSSPSYKFHVYNTDPVVNINSLSDYQPTLTANQASNLHSAWNQINTSSTFNFNCSLWGAVNRINLLAGQSGAVTATYGSVNDTWHYGTGTVTSAFGSSNQVVNTSTGIITNAYGAYHVVSKQGAGAITNGYGIYIDYVQATNKWGIYVNDATAPVYFASNLGIGTSSPATRLDVRGTHTGAGAGTGASSDAPSEAIIMDGSGGASRYNDWPAGWGGGLSTWDICGASSYLTGYATRSDKRFKKDVLSLSDEKNDIMNKFMQLRAVSYFINPETLKTDDLLRKRFGFIANEIENIFPNLVINAGMPDNITRGLEYDGFIPVLVSVVQEQQTQIKEQQKLINDQKAVLQRLTEEVEKLKQKK